MKTVVADSLQRLYRDVLYAILYEGKEVEVRGLMTKEIHPCLMHITNPKKRTLLYPKRGNNPFATLAETMWVLAGRNDMKFLTMFLPRAADFSDDGQVWRAGYGPRLRYWKYVELETQDHVNYYTVSKYTDQIEFVIKQLQKDLNSRQAVMSIWDPSYENIVEKTKDYPCCNWIHFMVRDGALDCTVVVRSNDAIWGLSSINVYEWTVLQEIIANALGLPVGQYYQMSDSLHLYQDMGKNNNWETAMNMAESCIDLPDLPEFKFGGRPMCIKEYLSDMEKMCNLLLEGINGQLKSKFEDLNLIYALLDWYVQRETFNSPQDAWKCYNDKAYRLYFCDLYVACDYWVHKNMFKEKDTGRELIEKCIEECKT